MPPKKGAKKGKKGEDEEYWQAKEAALPTVNPANGDDDDDVAIKSGKKKNVKSAFAMLQEEGGGGDEDDEEVPQPSSKSKKKKKNAPSPPPSDDDEPSPAPAAATQASLDDEWPEEDVKPKKGKKGKKSKKIDDEDLDVDMDAMIEEKKPIEVDMDDEFPDVKKKSKKDKKKKKVVDDDEQEQMDVDEEVTEVPVAPAAELEDEWPEEEVKKKGKKEKNNAKKEVVEVEKVDETVDAEENEEEGDGVKILSKKEKEKLKKEKEKAKKKAQAAAKKAETSTPTISEPAEPIDVVPESAAHAQEEDGDEDGDDVAGGAGDKKKKKKKKKAAAEVEEPKGKPKKVSAAVLALQRAMEDKKAAEAEAMRKAEEERLRIEEEDRRLEEEERVREEAKQLKKEKEKAKREQLRKEGKLLTPKQKAEQAAMEQRRKALLASGVKVEGLAGDSDKSKKVVYGNKKKQVKKAPVAADSSKSEAAPSAASEAPVEEAKVSTPVANAEEVDDWDKEDEDKVDDLVKGVEGVAIESGDDWDKSSSEDEAPPTPKATPAPAKVNQAPAAAPPLAKASAANGKKSTPAPAPAKKAQTNGADKPTATASASKAPPSAKVPAKGKAPAAKPVEEDSTEESEEDSDEESSEYESSSESDSDDSDSETDSSEDELTPAQKKAAAEAERRLQEAAARRQQRHVEAMAARSKDDLRSPICCILGHVDTGKTKLLDKMRQTNVQEGEAGGITQQIGATFFPVEAIKEKTQVVNRDNSLDFKIPGLLIIDTPGHESFTNLRTRGSSLCNIAILVVDIMHGLEPQTLESLRLLKDRKTPFIVALNKIDRLLDWKPIPNAGFRETFNQQSKKAKAHFEDALLRTKTAFMENSLNSIIFDENKDFGRVVSLVPTSAITGEGIPDMIKLLVELTQQRMTDSLMYLAELECTVLEVKVIEGLGPTIDVVLSNGVMREGDKIVLCGSKGPIVTQVRALLTPQPMRELRVKSAYVHNKEVKASLGIKISAPGLADAIAGSRLLVCGPDDDEDDLKADVMKDFTDIRKFYTDSGVWVQASTLGSLEALLEFLKTSKIPVRFAEIGPVSERTVKSAAVQMDKDPMYGVMLCFDVVIDKDVRKSAEDAGLKVFEAQIIYHLFDAFTAYMKAFLEEKQKAAAPKAYWPCRLKILAAFAKRDPIVVGVDIIEGSIRVGTPLCVVRIDKTTKQKEIIPLGKITSIEINKKAKDGPVKKADIGGGAAIKIEHASYQASKMYGRHFDDSDELISQISRESIDILKTTFRKDVDLADWALIKSLKPLLDIP